MNSNTYNLQHLSCRFVCPEETEPNAWSKHTLMKPECCIEHPHQETLVHKDYPEVFCENVRFSHYEKTYPASKP